MACTTQPGLRQRTQSPEFVDPVLLCAAMARAISLPAGSLKLFFTETKTPELWLEMRLWRSTSFTTPS